MTLNPELLHLALGLNRILTYTGYVLLAGTFAFWSLVWPEGRTDRRLVSLAAIGAGLMVVGTVGAPLIWVSSGQPLGDALSPVGGTGAIIRLAILVGVAFFFVDLIAGHRWAPISFGWHRRFAGCDVGGPVQRGCRAMAVCQDCRHGWTPARRRRLARRPRCAGSGVDSAEEPAGTRCPDSAVLDGCGVQRRHPRDHGRDSCACCRWRCRRIAKFSLWSRVALQIRLLRRDAAAGQ